MKFPMVRNVAFCLSLMLASALAFAQTAPQCADPYDRCSAQFSGRHRNQRTAAAANLPLCTLGAAISQDSCDATYERAQVCAPTVVSGNRNITLAPGESVTVTCGAASGRPNRARVNDQLLVHCDERVGAVLPDQRTGTCACQEIPGYNTSGPVVTSNHVVGRHLVASYRVAPHAREISFGCIYVPNGSPRPSEQLVLRILGAVIEASEALSRRVDGIDGRLRVVEGIVGQRPTPTAPTAPAPTATSSATRVGLGLGGFYLHMPGASDTGGFGLSVSVLQHPANWTVGFLGRVNLGLGFQPLVPGSSPLWSLAGSAQVHIGRDVVALNVGLAAATLSRFGSAARGEVTGGTAWWIALAVGPEFNWDHFTVGVDFLFGGGQTVGLVGNTSVNPSSFPAVGGLFRAEYRFF
jgi:hypothetical protein